MLITYEAAAALLGMTPGALRAAVSRGAVPHIRISERCVRFDRDALVAWLRERSVPARSGVRTMTIDAGDQVVELAAGTRR